VERGEQGAEGRLAQAEARHAELLERRERRRKELERQRALSLPAVERIASVLVLPHPERERPEVQQRRPRGAARGAQGTALAPLCGRLPALRPKGRLHPPTGVRTATAALGGRGVPDCRGVAACRQDWLAVRQARAGETERKLQEPIKDPARFDWNEVTKVAHYYLSVNTLTAQSPPETKT
jgi:hypothetical protein